MAHRQRPGYDKGPDVVRCRLRCGALSFSLLFGGGTVMAQSEPAEPRPFPARVKEVARGLSDHPRLKEMTQQEREDVVEFVVGNMLFVLLHELAHTAVADLKVYVLGHEEDAADDFAILRLLKVGSAFTHRVLAEATKGWFFSARRDRNDGEPLAFYDEHSLDQQRAYHIVCLMVGFNPDEMVDLYDEMKLPDERRESCKKDFAKASLSWETALKTHHREVDEPKTKIEVAYGDGTGKLDIFAQGFRTVRMLETVAERISELAWPAPFTLEMQSCGFINARWTDETRKLTLCYELAADFAELYHDFNKLPMEKRERERASVRSSAPAVVSEVNRHRVLNSLRDDGRRCPHRRRR